MNSSIKLISSSSENYTKLYLGEGMEKESLTLQRMNCISQLPITKERDHSNFT